MAAGQGFKTFVTGEVLTSGDVNGYLMQGINVFTNATARDAAITAPAEGQFAFTKDNNSLWYYDGAAWVASGATGDIEGVTAGVGISGGGTSGTVTVTNSMATAIDAKGDLVPGTGADTFARLAVGANGTVLTADSAEATGLKWAAAAGGSQTFTAINAGGTSLSGSSTVTISGLSGYSTIFMFYKNASSNGADMYIVRLNADTGANYYTAGMWLGWGASNSVTGNGTFQDGATRFNGGQTLGAAGSAGGSYQITGANSTGVKPVIGWGTGQSNGGEFWSANGYYAGTSVISSISLISTTNFDAGTIYVFGA